MVTNLKCINVADVTWPLISSELSSYAEGGRPFP
jgi:hypothetical protein